MWLFREAMVSVYVVSGRVVSRILNKGGGGGMNGLSCGFNTWYGGGDGRRTCVKHRSPDIMPYLNSPGKMIVVPLWAKNGVRSDTTACNLLCVQNLMAVTWLWSTKKKKKKKPALNT